MEQIEQDLDHDHEDMVERSPDTDEDEVKYENDADEDEVKWENDADEDESGTSFEYKIANYEGRLEDLKGLILTRDEDVKLEYVSNENWQALANHLTLKDTPKPSLRHLQIIANEDDVPYITLLFELLEPGLETLILFIDHPSRRQREATARGEYAIDSKKILKHSATLKTFAIHDRFGRPDEGAIVLETGDFDCIRPILEVCDLKEVSIPVNIDIQQFEKATNRIYTRGFDKLRLDTLETLYLVPYNWPGIAWGMGCDGDVSGWVEKPLADFLRGVFGNCTVRPSLRYICLGMQARTQSYQDRWMGERFSYKIKWRRSRTEEKQTNWYPKVKDIPFLLENGFRVWPVLFYDGW
ncbi:hypothetical protein TWF281_000582 [Arthrobotrys megalospora]